MRVTVLIETPEFRVTSHGNGLAYEFRALTGANEASAFFQGDDASTFETELQSFREAFGNERGLQELWNQYEGSGLAY